jgi:hypothetical protein
VLGAEGWQWLREGEPTLLPTAVRPARLRWTWAALLVIVLVLVGVVVAIGTLL